MSPARAACLAVLLALGASLPGADGVAADIVYNRDIRPILAENCFACHGPDARKRKAGLGLHTSELATAVLDSGSAAVVPGRPEASGLVERIRSPDPDERMPPEDSGRRLSPAQVDLLSRWIAGGAQWQPHWAYIPPRAVAPPAADRWVRTPIDGFVLARLRREGLQPSPPADPVTLIRRLCFDLTGLPPTPAEVDAFVADHGDEAYARLVDRLLASPRYGERMATAWLDLVRYGDTTGYHSDNTRNVVPYRDWVIAAFNADLPFDRFTIEQLAGDLLPGAETAQRVASGYNRLIMTTEEGGAQPREYENKHAADRVRNVSAVWMGATMGCCECHDHKFDPYSARDFYAMAAFFADIQEAPIGAREPGMAVPTVEQVAALAALAAEAAPIDRELATPTAGLAAQQAAWEAGLAGLEPPRCGPWSAIGPFPAASATEAFATAYPPEAAIDLAATYPVAGGQPPLAWVAHPEWADGAVHTLSGANAATYLVRTITAPAAGALPLSLGSDDTITVWINGAQVLAHEVYRGVAPDQEQITVPLVAGANTLLMKIVNGGGGYGFHFQVAGKPAPDAVLAILAIPADRRTAEQRETVAAFHRTIAPALAPARARRADLDRRQAELEAAVTRCLVTTAGPPRTVRVRPRGNWQDDSGEVVEPAVPHFLAQLPAGARATRLDLARWLVADGNPLTARVFMNRQWRMLFGTGLSRSLDDLGAQGEWPVHPELLDWLAEDLRGHGWGIKRALRQLVMSAAYRQSSHAGALAERDPDNRLIARQSRFRLDAEFVRDDALAISGLLVERVGGPAVRPYQPAGYLRHLNFPARDWTDERGDGQYRRGLYTFWQRTFLHPSLLAFDASTREECTAERPRSNTPQQALVLLNDPTYVEAARTLAASAVAEGGATAADRLAWIFRRAVSRRPTADEALVCAALLADNLAIYRADGAAAARVLAVGSRPAPDGDAAELAAWTAVARAVLNLHETITRY